MRNKLIIAILFGIFPFFSLAQKDTEDVNKLLGLSLEDLMNIKVVTASGYMQTTAEAPSTIQVITSKQITERGYEQLEDALRDIPGIDMIHINGYAPTFIYFRGMYGAENLRALLMIDGIAENNLIGSNDIAGPAYSLHNVDRIEVIWGPASALYGANAFGGVINIITKKGGDMNGFRYEKGFGSFNTSVDKLSFGVNKSKFDIAISGSLYSTDGPVFKNRDPNYTASYVDKAYSLNATISYSLKKSKFKFGGRVYNTPMGFGTFLNSPTVLLGLPSQGYGNSGVLGLIARDVRGEKSGLEEPFARTFYLQHEYKATPKLNFLTRLIYRETGISEKSYAYLTVNATRLYRVPTTNYSNRIGGEIGINYADNKKYQFSGGIQFFQDNIEHGDRKINFDTTIYLLDGRDTLQSLFSTFKKRTFDIWNTFGSYAQFIWNTRFLKKTSFTFGLRYDINNYYGNPISPRIAVVSQPTDKFSFKLMFGRAFRAPTNTEIIQAPTTFKLKTEKIITYEVNFLYQFSPKLHAQLNGFRNVLNDVIFLANLVNLQQNKNPGKITIHGMEAKLDANFTKSISAFFNLTFQDALSKSLVSGLSRGTAGIARIKSNFGVSMYVKDLFTFSITNNWVGKRQVPGTDPYGPVAGYFLTNCTLSTDRFFKNRVSASIAVRNVFNVKYLDPGFRSADGFIYSTVLEQPGINGLVKICLNLNNN
ncbi:MAG: TonB-dependent receptor plug domain-containing protein [Ferruginibacter sp.]